jgi:hypothetical protein
LRQNPLEENTVKIINLFSMFKNPYDAPGWQVWRGRDLLAVFHTHAQARAYARARA